MSRQASTAHRVQNHAASNSPDGCVDVPIDPADERDGGLDPAREIERFHRLRVAKHLRKRDLGGNDAHHAAKLFLLENFVDRPPPTV